MQLDQETSDSQHQTGKQKTTSIWQPVGFTLAALAYPVIWKTGALNLKYPEWEPVIGLGGLGLFGFMAVFSWISYFLKLNPRQEDNLFLTAMKWTILGPILLLIGGFVVVFVGSWMLGIPDWAAVIIVLQVLILIRTGRRPLR